MVDIMCIRKINNSIMMKKLMCLSIILILAVLTGCKSNEEVIKFKPYKPKDYITKKAEVYEVKELLYPVLDSLILKAEACPMYQGLENNFGFVMNICVDCGSIPSVELAIEVIFPKFRNHSERTQAVFYYKDYDFYLNRSFSDDFLIKTGRFISIPCINPKKYQDWAHDRGDMDMIWAYKYIDGQLVNTFYKPCRKGE